jgi:hypothetical protein
MPVHILRILLSELSLVRLVCKKCGTAVELDIANVRAASAQHIQCAGCGGILRRGPFAGQEDELNHLAIAVEHLKVSNTVSVELVLPEKGAPR